MVITPLKVCTLCKLAKAPDGFYKHKGMLDGRLKQCKVCRNAYVSAWAARNPDRKKAIARQHAAANYDSVRRAKAWAKWYASEKAADGHVKMANRNAQRRLTCKRATPIWYESFFVEEAYRLAKLRTKMTGVEWQVDHIVPLTSDLVSGLHVIDNLQVITKTANLSKKNYHWPQMPERV